MAGSNAQPALTCPYESTHASRAACSSPMRNRGPSLRLVTQSETILRSCSKLRRSSAVKVVAGRVEERGHLQRLKRDTDRPSPRHGARPHSHLRPHSTRYWQAVPGPGRDGLANRPASSRESRCIWNAPASWASRARGAEGSLQLPNQGQLLPATDFRVQAWLAKRQRRWMQFVSTSDPKSRLAERSRTLPRSACKRAASPRPLFGLKGIGLTDRPIIRSGAIPKGGGREGGIPQAQSAPSNTGRPAIPLGCKRRVVLGHRPRSQRPAAWPPRHGPQKPPRAD